MSDKDMSTVLSHDRASELNRAVRGLKVGGGDLPIPSSNRLDADGTGVSDGNEKDSLVQEGEEEEEEQKEKKVVKKEKQEQGEEEAEEGEEEEDDQVLLPRDSGSEKEVVSKRSVEAMAAVEEGLEIEESLSARPVLALEEVRFH
jgi:hypothetical protein